ncbi:hypothetical protein DQ04_09911000 [Trypanosoma grayi]|uniref:hypothetical protein n=1 Tax=Trypanosoma grayi TaxID=71804 RepID=UPI0004F448E5|nr:hypothetical protein DQ04_09911000 [Trypanosoma grayi]KEG07399.1 hypothetical protein DQ04_09911000 [Trypanosoma grayi]
MASTIQQPPLLYTITGPEDLLSDDDDITSYLNDVEDEEGTGSEVPLAAPLLSHAHSPKMGPEDLYTPNDVTAAGDGSGRRRSGSRFHSDVPPLNEPRRFWQLVVGALCCFAVSSSYAFNLYSGQLQSKYNFTQNQMTTITTLSDVVGGFTLPFGVIYDYYGAKPLFVIAMITFPLGAVMFGLTYADAITGSVPAFAVYACLQSLGTSMLDISAVMTLLSIFPANRGAVVAVMKTFSGMGSAILGAIHMAFFGTDSYSDTSRFFFLLASVTAVVSFLGFLFVEVPPYMIKGCEEGVLSEEERRVRRRYRKQYLRRKAPTARFAIGFTVLIALTIFLPVQGALSAFMNLSHASHVAFACIALGLFAFYPLMALPIKALDRKLQPLEVGSYSSGSCRVSRMSRLSRMTRESTDSTALAAELDYIAPQFQTTLVENLRTFRFWALLWTMFCLFGAQIIVIGNARFLFGALAGNALDEAFVALLVVIMGVGSGVGRILLSILEMVTQNRSAEDRIPITFALFVPTGLTVATIALLLLLPRNALPLPCFTMALANGCSAAAIVIVVRTIYAADVAKHYNCCMITGIAASVLMNRLLYGEWYTHQAAKRGSAVCFGKECVLMPLLVCFGMNLSAVFSSALIHWDYEKYCRKMLDMRKRRLRRAQSRSVCHANSNNNDDDDGGASIEAKTTVGS